jgi:hypothetical protein
VRGQHTSQLYSDFEIQRVRAASLRSSNQFTQFQSQSTRQSVSNLNPDADLAQFYGTDVGPVDVSPLGKILLRKSKILPLAADGSSEGKARESGCLCHTSLLIS